MECRLHMTFCVMMVSLLLLTSCVSCSQYHIMIHADNVTSNLAHFWESTGFCPPEPHQEAYRYFLSEDEKQNVVYIGSIPHSGLRQVRIHWLLDMVTLSMNHDGIVSYNFTLLDQLIDTLWYNKLRPGFELMGNPSNLWTDFEDRKQVYMWKDMVTVLAKRYIDIYGLDYLSTWNFETWNEPDHKDFDGLNFTVQGFLNYYDACSEGLKAANSKLILGAPGASCRKPSFSVICWALLDHCVNGVNYFTQQTGVRLDYISFHHKGKGQSIYILDTELATIETIHKTYPELAKVPIFNNEADPLVGWSNREVWRADVTYAAIVAKIIAQHQNLLLSKRHDINYALLSNDNGFMNFYPSFFDQRTLTARFQINNTKPQYVDFIKKPVLSVMGLLALLGNQQVETTTFLKNGFNSFIKAENDTDVGVIASVRQSDMESWQVAILVYNSADTNLTTGTDTVKLNIHGLRMLHNKDLSRMYSLYLLDNKHGNPYETWKSQSQPVFPTRKQLQAMRAQQEAVRIKGPDKVTNSSMTLDFNLNKPGVLLLHICDKPSSPPGQVSGLRLHNITSQDILVIWDDSTVESRCLLTYQVELSTTGKEGIYDRINTVDIIFTTFVHSLDAYQESKSMCTGACWYRVCATDYWNQNDLKAVPPGFGIFLADAFSRKMLDSGVIPQMILNF